jgi:lipoprotein-releasing system ATP-binding protein
MSNILDIKDVHKYFEHRGYTLKVLKGISLSISKGESVAITGVSGSGKTTLLNIMGGLEPPTKGKVRFLEKDIYQMKENELNSLRNRDMGFVFQFHYLLPELNAVENVMMPALIAGCNKRDSYEKAVNILERLGLKNRLYHKPGELSGGEQQRVAIARAFIMNPKVILADEPTGNLDRDTGRDIVKLLLELNKKDGVAIVIATHDMEIAFKMSRSFELKNGVLVEIQK